LEIVLLNDEDIHILHCSDIYIQKWIFLNGALIRNNNN